MKKNLITLIAFILFTFCYTIFFTSCENKNIAKEIETLPDSTASSDTLSKETEGKYDYVISNIPIPFEILDKLFKSGVKYNKELPNSIGNNGKYLQANSKALNLGIYGADLTYVISFEQFNQISGYLKNAKKIADDLGIPLAFNQETLERYEVNRSNKDTLENMIYKSYNEVDKTLKSGERISLAALVVTGGWVEGLHLTAQTLAETENEASVQQLQKIIWQQHFHLDNIIDLLEEFNDDKYFTTLNSKLVEIQHIYDFMNPKNITKTEIKAITEKVASLRKEITEASF